MLCYCFFGVVCMGFELLSTEKAYSNRNNNKYII